MTMNAVLLTRQHFESTRLDSTRLNLYLDIDALKMTEHGRGFTRQLEERRLRRLRSPFSGGFG